VVESIGVKLESLEHKLKCAGFWRRGADCRANTGRVPWTRVVFRWTDTSRVLGHGSCSGHSPLQVWIFFISCQIPISLSALNLNEMKNELYNSGAYLGIPKGILVILMTFKLIVFVANKDKEHW